MHYIVLSCLRRKEFEWTSKYSVKPLTSSVPFVLPLIVKKLDVKNSQFITV